MPDLLDQYPLTPGTYHEMLDASGAVRPHWQRLYEHLQRSTPAQLIQRQALLARQIQENGVTYNVYADPKGADRPWELDMLPHVIPMEEWQPLAAGIAQRARLLNAVLADLYGPQELIAEGLLPSELVFGHNNFLWPCQGVTPPEGTFLHVYAVDLARTPDGRWWVTADRTQAPSGAGYALENRLIVSRAFPELYRDLQVQHLSNFFRSLQETLARQAPTSHEAPLVVLLTPGRFNESYFEHLYLAGQLGYPLVEGSDLTVRDATVYLKTLSGLRRVHAIMRRLDDDFCDPLELRTDSALGVPGLLQAVRQGRVLVANALGSGVLESPGLLGFLPKKSCCCRRSPRGGAASRRCWRRRWRRCRSCSSSLHSRPRVSPRCSAAISARKSVRRCPRACRPGPMPTWLKNWRSCPTRRSGRARTASCSPAPSACACTR
jgi:uncharacterized circularly permuted ATP-grasp superfamily protein